ncbi:MAG: carbohydrate ABC transporter permease [Mycobacteriales bacterium]
MTVTATRRRGTSVVARTGRGRAGWLVRIVLTVLCVLWLIPTTGTVVTSFRTVDAVNSSGWWTAFGLPPDPSQLTLAGYRQVWNSGMAQSFGNSIAVTLPAVLIPILIAAFAAYAFTFMDFLGRKVLFSLVVALLVVPVQVALAPLLRLYGGLGLNGTYPAAYLAHIGFGLPLGVLLLRNYMATLPRTLIDAARVDGASHYQVFWRLVMPLSVPALAAYAVFQLITVWSDLLIALVFLGEGDKQTVTMTLGGQIGQVGGRGWQAVSGSALVVLGVPVLVFLVLQRYFIRGLLGGAVNG